MQFIPFYDPKARWLVKNKPPVTDADPARHIAFIHVLIQARHGRYLAQSELAQRIGTSQTVISRIENLKTNPSLKMLLKIAEALEVTLTLVE